MRRIKYLILLLLMALDLGALWAVAQPSGGLGSGFTVANLQISAGWLVSGCAAVFVILVALSGRCLFRDVHRWLHRTLNG